MDDDDDLSISLSTCDALTSPAAPNVDCLVARDLNTGYLYVPLLMDKAYLYLSMYIPEIADMSWALLLSTC
jgi:hypothetical protein